jgi:hypothetical protein
MNDIEKTISVINQMTYNGVIENYALGGATAVIFYTEPIATEDIDVFVHVRRAGQSVLMEFQPLFDYLRERGYEIKGEHAYIEGFPVQFLPISKDLINEAVIQANEFELSGGVRVRVMSPQYLVAIMLDTGRMKDFLWPVDLEIKYFSMDPVTSKSAITPSLIGRIATIEPGVRPSMSLASLPTARTRFCIPR